MTHNRADRTGPRWRRRLSLWHRKRARNRFFPMAMAIGVSTVAFDQITKNWIVYGLRLPERPFGQINLSQIFDLTFVQNRGVSFGMFAGGISSRIILSALSLVVAGMLVGWLATQRRKWTSVGIGFIIGGALGNFIDRAIYGWVIDFLDFSGLYFPWVFNIADSAINIGVACLLLDTVLQYRAAKRPERIHKTGNRFCEENARQHSNPEHISDAANRKHALTSTGEMPPKDAKQ